MRPPRAPPARWRLPDRRLPGVRSGQSPRSRPILELEDATVVSRSLRFGSAEPNADSSRHWPRTAPKHEALAQLLQRTERALRILCGEMLSSAAPWRSTASPSEYPRAGWGLRRTWARASRIAAERSLRSPRGSLGSLPRVAEHCASPPPHGSFGLVGSFALLLSSAMYLSAQTGAAAGWGAADLSPRRRSQRL
jgi:hypothetical protein